MSLFKTFQKDRKIETTPFDLSFQNLLTANFGGLTPLGSYPVLPKDRFKIGSNILTKVEPMPAPAFCRIKQNTYAFFTPNSTVWKHWNDYVTNGTAYADTYGNNSNNQKTDNQWRPPQVSFNDIQLISKIANGWAIPVFRLTQAQAGALVDFMVDAVKIHNPSFYEAYLSSFPPSAGVSDRMRVIFWTCYSILRRVPELGALSILDDIPYFEICRKVVDGVRNFYIDFGCDLLTAHRFFVFCNSLGSQVTQTKQTYAKKNIIKTEVADARFFPIMIRTFCDNISEDVSLNHGPFRLEKKTYAGEETDGRLINYYVYKKNLYEDIILEDTTYDTENSQKVYRYRKVRRCGYFWSNDIIKIETGNSQTSNIYVPYLVNNAAFNPYPTTPSHDFLTDVYGGSIDGFLSDDYQLTLHNFKNTYNEIFYDPYIASSSIPSIGSDTQLSGSSPADTDGVDRTLQPFHFGNKSVAPRHAETDGLNFWSAGIRLWYNYTDVEFPLFYDKCTTQTQSVVMNYVLGTPPTRLFFTNESFNIGYDAFSFVVYLCQNCTKLLDYYNIPLEGVTSRSWSFYAGEYLKMLPFFGYSKIWNDYFRNKITSTAELDYSETNSEACYDSSRYQFYKHCKSRGIHFPDWKSSELDEEVEKLNGWSLPFDCSPKNSLSDYNLTVSGTEIHLSDVFHFHDLRVRNYWTLFSVLTGAQLYNVCLNSICVNYDSYSKELYGILADKLYLPSYYNGLLHYKYQNFNKDYFSSALLDPAAGANDEQIGDTVSSLVTAQAKQGFWNRLANNRSVKQFWNSVFGIDPSHDEYDKPLLLGSAHTDVNIGEVIQLSQTESTPQGQRSGLGSAHDKHGLCNKQFNEHGYVLILLSHTLELQYMQGLEKDWTPEESFLDLPFIDFVGLGNQSINQRELNFTSRPRFEQSIFSKSSEPDGSTFNYFSALSYKLVSKVNNVYPSSPQLMTRPNGYVSNGQPVNLDRSLSNGSGYNFNDVFGYIPRYSTWKFKLDQCHGEFRNSLDFWHSFRKFFTQPILCHEFVNWEFMSENDELGRMFFMLDDSTDKFKIDAFINCTAYRPLPYVCVPTTSKS